MELYFSEINISKCFFKTHEALIIINNDKELSKHIIFIRQITFMLSDFYAELHVTNKHKLTHRGDLGFN